MIDFPRGRGSGLPPQNNLPLPLTSFVGREREIADLEKLLAGGTRLLTLTGAGGSGKTRLALSAASELAGGFEDGVWWVELAALSGPDLVAQAVASTLSVREAPGRSLTETLVEYLENREVLLVLDNCEHLIGACAQLADVLLHACPHLRILATSREPLGVAGESAWLVPPLVLPEAGQQPPIEEMRQSEAISLFVERAQAVVSTFELTEHNAPAVGRLCRKLDGMPLAIELAAARVRVLSVEQITARLEDSLRLLTGGSRTAAPRHQTLRATLAWGYELLSEPEQKLFGRLSVFAGGWTLEAAEAVGSGGDIEREDVLDLLAHLVDKSMVVSGAGAEGASRYRMLEPVRQYGQERLEVSGEAGLVQGQHAEFCLALAEEAQAELNGPRQVDWLDRLEEDHDNLRAAIRWALEQGETEIALRLTASAAHFQYPRGYLNEGRSQLETALAGHDAGTTSAARAKALTEAGWFALEQSDYDEGQRSLEESLLLYRELGDDYGVAHALECLVVAKTRLSDYGLATQHGEESLALYRELDHKWGIAMSLVNLGILAQERGEYEQATAFYLEGLALLRDVGDSLSIGYVLSLLGQLYLMQGQLERSTELLEESQSLLRQLGDKLTLATTLCNLGETVFRQGDGTRAGAIYKESLALAAQVGSRTRVASCLEGLAELALTHGQPAHAARLWGAEEVLGEATGLPLSRFNHSLPEHERLMAVARSQLGDGAFEVAWTEGQAMTHEQAVDYALSEGEMPGSPPPSTTSYPAGLSAREAEVLRLVAKGLTNAQIAKELFISPRTVDRHLNSVYRKAGVSSRVAAARFATEHDLL